MTVRSGEEMSEQEREKFEKWYSDTYLIARINVSDRLNDGYRFTTIQLAWHAWQAALRTPDRERATAGEEMLAEVDALIEKYGIDTVGTGSAQSKKEDERVNQIIDAALSRHRTRQQDKQS